ncbi:MAG: acetyl-CoA acetyltransferase [Bacteroidota bacterium]|jgi:acetyl-CoA acyltransferase
MQEAYIVKAFRTAVGKAKKGSFRHYRSDDLAVEVIRHLLRETPSLDPGEIDDCIVGCANPEGEQGLQVGRLISLRAIGEHAPGMTINRYCASGLESIALAVAKIRAGMAGCIVAGGTESMSMIPMTGYKLAPSYEVARNNPVYLTGMGQTAEAVADRYGITREEADLFAVESHRKAAAALAAGRFREGIVPITVTEVRVEDDERRTRTWTMDTDEGVRPDTTAEALARLAPAFRKGGVVTAGNASQTSDGAAFVLVMSEAMVNRLQLEPIARLASCAVAGVDPLYMGMGPCKAIPLALRQAGLQLQQVEQIELNEAFAAQALAVIREAGLDPALVNVNGGAVALGHPLGCTGTKLTVQLLEEMRRRGQRYGMVTACVGGGQGIAGIYERLS